MITFWFLMMWLGIVFYVGIRNFQVREFQLFIVNRISYENRKRIFEGTIKTNEIEDMYKISESVSYCRMLFSFWKPLTIRAFYKDEKFLKYF